MKKCIKCDLDKEINSFMKGRNVCKECYRLYQKNYNNKYYKENKDELIIKNKQYRSNNNDILLFKKKDYYENNKELIKLKQKKYRAESKELKSEYNSKYREENKDYIKLCRKEYYLKNREIILTKVKIYRQSDDIKKEINKKLKERRETEPIYKLSVSTRNMISKSLRRNGYKKNSKTYEILGCSFEDFKLYIENKFDIWMNWDNYGKYNGELNYGWDIDHICPISEASTEEDIIKLNYYTNLQPLCSKINRDIKKNNKDYES